MKLLLHAIWESDRKAFLTILLWNIVVSILGGIGIVMLIPLLNMLQIGDSRLPGWFLAFPYPLQVGMLLAGYLLLVTAKALLSRSLSIRENAFVEANGMTLRGKLYAAVSGTGWENIASRKDTDIISLFTYQCSEVSYGFSEVIHFLAGLVSAAVQLAIALMMSLPVTALVCVMGACMLAVFKPMKAKSRDYGDEMIRISREFYGELQNQLASIKEVRAYGVEEEHASLFNEISESFLTARMRYVRQSSVPGMVYSLTAAGMIALVYLVCTLGLRVETDRLVVLVYVFARLWPLFSGFQGQIQNIHQCVPAYEKLTEALRELQPEAAADETDEKGEEGEESKEGEDFSRWQEIRFEDVHFVYHDSEEETLRGVDFSLKRGEKLALLGRNGAGKTTAVNLLLGFLLPEAGAICIDGAKLSSSNIRAWRRQVGYVPQDPLILNASVRENLTRFHPGTGDEELIAALQKAMAWDFVSRLADGLDTILGDRGIRLSGGERQRIVLARVLLGHPSLIVLDEATSALDYETEAAFHDVITSLEHDAAVVLIAHHSATIAMADTAVVLENGTVAEKGAVADLMRQKGSYLSEMAGV